jgi:hypothetical protein
MLCYKSPLKYFPIKVGKAEISFSNGSFILSHDSKRWMGYNDNTGLQVAEFVMELELAYGHCVTSGLGLGIIQMLLAKNDRVTKVSVYEKNEDVINLFYKIIEMNNADISKIEIINRDADSMENISCDCMFLDHFQDEPEAEIVSRVKNISLKNSAKTLWYWPGSLHFIAYCLSNGKNIGDISYQNWKNKTGINFLPENLTEIHTTDLAELKEKYLTLAPRYNNLQNIQYKNYLKSINDK